MKIKRVLSLFGVVFFLFSSFQTIEGAISKKAKYKRRRLNAEPYLDPRSLGRGNTYITTATDEGAMFTNPALIPQPKNGFFSKMYLLNPTIIGSMSIFKSVKDIQSFADTVQGQGSNDLANLSSTFKEVLEIFERWETEPVSVFGSTFLGASFRYISFGFLFSASLDFDSGLDTVESHKEKIRMNTLVNVGPVLSFTSPIPYVDGLSVGVTAKYLARGEVHVQRSVQLADLLRMQSQKDDFTIKKLTGWDHKPGFDFGIVYKPKLFLNPRFGLVFNNIGNMNFSDQDGEPEFEMEPIRQNLGIGASIHPVLGPGVLSASLDIRDLTASYDTSFLSELHIGLDYVLWEMLGFSTGLNQGYPTAGVFFTSRFLQVDLGVYTKERELRIGQKPEPRFFFKLTTSF